jgi:phospholipid/cholesterol/gamma-HCH transport system permease protein
MEELRLVASDSELHYGTSMNTVISTERHGAHASLAAAGPFDIAHAAAVLQAVDHATSDLHGCHRVDVDLTHLERIDGTGAVLLARLIDGLDTAGLNPRVAEEPNPEAARLIALYRSRRTGHRSRQAGVGGVLERLGASAATLPGAARHALDFTGRWAAAVPKAIVTPPSVNWRSLPMLIQNIGADALLVTGAANLLVGIIIGFLGVSQLGRFGAVAYVPELVVVLHFREMGALVTAIVVAGRSGAGLASEIATMKVSEEIDALRSMGFDPVRWLVVPRTLALVIVLPILVWIGDVVAPIGGLLATTTISDMTARSYLTATAQAITGAHVAIGLVKSPFLALAIALVACGEGLSTQGGAAAVGARTTAAVVIAIFSVIVINALFTLLFVLIGV